MAQRRMMSLHIIDTDAFMDMPLSSQCLYMHMLMRADDDGFVSNVKKIMRMVGCSDDDLKILLGKKFLIPFDDGLCVIKHWRIHNYIQADRYQPTKYIDEKALLSLKDNGAYTVDTPCIQDVSIVDTQVRLGKDRLGKDNTKEAFGVLENVLLTADEHQKLITKYGRSATTNLLDELSTYIPNAKTKYKDHYATLLNWAKRKGLTEVKAPVVNQSVKEAAEVTVEQVQATAEIRNKVRESLPFLR